MPRRVEDIRIDDAPSLDTLVRRLEAGGGFSAKGVAEGVDLLARILADRDMTTFLSFPADIVATGTRGVLATLVREDVATPENGVQRTPHSTVRSSNTLKYLGFRSERGTVPYGRRQVARNR